jgi:hypothetical protein
VSLSVCLSSGRVGGRASENPIFHSRESPVDHHEPSLSDELKGMKEHLIVKVMPEKVHGTEFEFGSGSLAGLSLPDDSVVPTIREIRHFVSVVRFRVARSLTHPPFSRRPLKDGAAIALSMSMRSRNSVQSVIR